jgi:hypothetical protein
MVVSPLIKIVTVFMFCVVSPRSKLGGLTSAYFALPRYTQNINTVGSSQVLRLPGLLFRGALLYATEYRVYGIARLELSSKYILFMPLLYKQWHTLSNG